MQPDHAARLARKRDAVTEINLAQEGKTSPDFSHLVNCT